MIAVHVSRRSFRGGRLQAKSNSLLELFLEIVGGPAVLQEQKLEPCPFAMFAQLARLAEQFGDTFDNGFNLVPANERVQAGREMRLGRESASDAQRESSFGFSIDSPRDRSQPNIINFWIGAPNAATGDRNLEFSRQVIKAGIARKHSGRG